MHLVWLLIRTPQWATPSQGGVSDKSGGGGLGGVASPGLGRRLRSEISVFGIWGGFGLDSI